MEALGTPACDMTLPSEVAVGPTEDFKEKGTLSGSWMVLSYLNQLLSVLGDQSIHKGHVISAHINGSLRLLGIDITCQEQGFFWLDGLKPRCHSHGSFCGLAVVC